jgi:hypothetical protein
MGTDWPAVVVAVGILLLLGGVLVTATARWTAADLKDIVGTLSPVLGVVTGAARLAAPPFSPRHRCPVLRPIPRPADDAARQHLEPWVCEPCRRKASANNAPTRGSSLRSAEPPAAGYAVTARR